MVTKSPSEIFKGCGSSCILYADSGVGKTTALGEIPGKTLIVDFEGGTTVLKSAKSTVEVVLIETNLSNLKEVMTELMTVKNNYDTICFDSITALETNILATYAAKSSSQMPTLQNYGQLNAKLQQIMLDMRSIKYQNKNVIITALELPFDEYEGGEAKTKLYPFVKASKGTMTKKMVAEVDIVGHLEISQKEESREKRFIRLARTDKIVAKDRLFGRSFCETKNLFQKES